MKLYALFSRLPFPKTYLGKIVVVAFLGIHLPLLALLVSIIVFPIGFGVALTILLIVLAATLLGTALTLYILYALLEPVSLASRALREYLEYEERPRVPDLTTSRPGDLANNLGFCRFVGEALPPLPNRSPSGF